VIFRGGKEQADKIVPISQYDTVDPEVLWQWMSDAERAMASHSASRVFSAPLYQRVVAIETKRQPLPVGNLVAYVGVDEARELLVAGLPGPARLVFARHLVDHRLVDHDARTSPIRRCNLMPA